ncbi:hypothetical protein [Tengunoibacter tsumagoiensis]|uniref:Uncharacterized protein n=1 Tax=Tengunoibacter tsumagoiensis TaxID=2014871 RepID=A0A401ZW75_9CHLR|nr:hypothetical protein [Tengunoibacter tsumagoiensis]GCE11161.1 hypothetical protein KTT_10200 [Tengunoibacter tsumagoiensis]
MFEPEDLLPLEQSEPQLIEDLCHLYTTHVYSGLDSEEKDRESQARIRERLLARSANALPVATLMSTDGAYIQSSGKGVPQMLHLISQQRPWQRRLSMVAVILIVAVLVGSLALVFTHLQRNSESHPPTPHWRYGWTPVKTFSGHGNAKFTDLALDFGPVIGMYVSCNKNSAIDVHSDIISAVGPCPTLQAGTLEPQSSQSAQKEDVIQYITYLTITASSTTSWNIYLLKGTYYQPLVVEPGWKLADASSNFSGVGSAYEALAGGELPQGSTWELQYKCYGPGAFSVQVFDTTGVNGDTSKPFVGMTLPSPSCEDGQAGVTHVVHMDNSGGPYKLSAARITANADAHWFVLIAICNSQSCMDTGKSSR